MGVQKNSASQLKYVKMKDGKFFLKDDPQPYDELQGRLIDIGFDLVEFQKDKGKVKTLYVVLGDEDGTYKLSFVFDNIATTTFLKFLKSSNLDQDIIIVPNLREEEGVKKRSIFLKQAGKFLKSYYSKDHPNGLPELKKTKFKGETKWDNGDQLEFLEKVVLEDIKPSLKEYTPPETVVGRPALTPSQPIDQTAPNDDDLPF